MVRESGSRPSGRSPTGSLQQSQPQPTPGRGLLGLRSGFMRRAARSAAARKLSEASECGAALGIPKVALLFLTPGDMPLEQVRRTCAPFLLLHLDRVLTLPDCFALLYMPISSAAELAAHHLQIGHSAQIKVQCGLGWRMVRH